MYRYCNQRRVLIGLLGLFISIIISQVSPTYAFSLALMMGVIMTLWYPSRDDKVILK